jgi:antitoxin component of RelBE/YafQ-DinJ toxin-antitoxin module
MDNVMTTSKAKDAFLQIRIREEVKQDLAVLAELRGLSMSALINSLIVKAIREEKNADPIAFRQKPEKNATANGIKFAGTAKGEQKSKRKVK